MKSAIDESTRVVRNPDLPSGEIDDELVAMNLQSGMVFGLDSVGAEVWKLAETPRTIGEIADSLIASHEVDRDRCLADIIPFIAELVDEGLFLKANG